MKNKHSKLSFWMKIVLLISPCLPLVIIYLYNDPYMILHNYKRFDKTKVLLPNEAYIGWENYMQNCDSIHYNSFILGNSCTMAFKTQAWEKHLNKKCKAVRFFDNAETIGGVFQKMQLLDSVGAKLENILIVIDRKSFINTDPLKSTNHLISAKASNISKIKINLRFLLEFLYPIHSLTYLEYLITGKYSDRMSNVIHDGPPIREPFTNNFINPNEKEIEQKKEAYWVEHKRRFRKKRIHKGEEEKPIISTAQIDLLHRMNQICMKHNTNIKIIIGPDYYQQRINSLDIKKLKEIFGNNAIWDFTGINEYTSDYHNYYEPGHYRPFIGEKLLEKIYANKLNF